MKTYCYLDRVSNEVGRVHPVVGHLQANSVEEAERICEKNGWEYDGELVEVIPVPEWSAMSEFCKEALDLRDRAWSFYKEEL